MQKLFIIILSGLSILSIIFEIPKHESSITPSQAIRPTQRIIYDPEDLDYEKTGAIEQIKELPEVETFIETLDDPGNVYMEIEKRDRKTITIHVGTKDKDHLDTFNWYTIEKETGKIKCSFNIYKNGKFIRASDPTEYPCF